MIETDTLLSVENLKVYFRVKDSLTHLISRDKKEPRFVRAVDGIGFDIHKGETLSLVGESGCGKTTVGRAIVGLNKPIQGSIRFDGNEISARSFNEMIKIRKDIQFVFQDPFASLNPRMTIYQTLSRPMIINKTCPPHRMRERAVELMNLVGLSKEQLARYPHEFSGGQRQRICIARCLSVDPKLIIADEPTASLDVSIQSQILNLLLKLKNELGLTMLFISHDLSVVNYISNRTAVMYLGTIVELGQSKTLFKDPLHPYSQALLEAVPRKRHGVADRKVKLTGSIPSPVNPPSGCSLHPRCPFAFDRCTYEKPELKRHDDRLIACHLYDQSGQNEQQGGEK